MHLGKHLNILILINAKINIVNSTQDSVIATTVIFWISEAYDSESS